MKNKEKYMDKIMLRACVRNSTFGVTINQEIFTCCGNNIDVFLVVVVRYVNSYGGSGLRKNGMSYLSYQKKKKHYLICYIQDGLLWQGMLIIPFVCMSCRTLIV